MLGYRPAIADTGRGSRKPPIRPFYRRQQGPRFDWDDQMVNWKVIIVIFICVGSLIWLCVLVGSIRLL